MTCNRGRWKCAIGSLILRIKVALAITLVARVSTDISARWRGLDCLRLIKASYNCLDLATLPIKRLARPEIWPISNKASSRRYPCDSEHDSSQGSRAAAASFFDWLLPCFLPLA